MKKKLIWLVILVVITKNLPAQKLMKIPDSLSAACTPLNVVWKMGLKKIQYEFGPYQLLSYKTGKESWQREGNRFTLFPKETYEQIKERSSFTLTNQSKDTAFVDVGVLSSLFFDDASNSFFYKGEKTYTGGVQVYTALISLNNDTTQWALMLEKSEMESMVITITKPFKGQIISANNSYYVIPVKKYQDGNTPLIGTVGFLFENNNKQAMAGVQFYGLPLKLQQQSFVWLPENTDDKLKMVFATAATAIMLRMHQTMGASIGDAGPPRR